ncbi:MAG: hypothetical protein ACKVHE_23775 [Planctomycetales bacterium]
MWHIESINVFVRELPPDRGSFVIGRQKAGETPTPPKKRRPRGFLVVRLELADDQGNRSWGVSGDRPSFGWLDKRPKYGAEQKLQRLLDLVDSARTVYLKHSRFASPFQQSLINAAEVTTIGRAADHEDLSGSFAAALFERAMIDAVCRLQKLSLFEAVCQNKLGFTPQAAFPELQKFRLDHFLSQRPLTTFNIRHTVGLADPLTKADLPEAKRLNDGEPETLEEFVARDGLRYLKVKISGDSEADLARLGKIWNVVARTNQPVITLDGNESYQDIDAFARFVEVFEEKQLGLFQHTEFIEQPLTRALTHDPATAQTVAAISQKKPLVIDEADGTLNSFRDAFQIGYSGTSHKNCKGFFKSLLNFCLTRHFEIEHGRAAFQTGEDLSNMPLVPLHQDFAALGILGVDHCERNGHHYSFGLQNLTDTERQLTKRHHPDLYVERHGGLFLNIRNGLVRCDSLQKPGFGVAFQPDFDQLTPLSKWEVQW